MNELQIRYNFHRKMLRYHHARENTLVIDELGLKHGKCRADIAVINGKLTGFEIKSDQDTLRRLRTQIIVYNSVFDYASIVVGTRQLLSAQQLVPKQWGVIVCTQDRRGAVSFEMLRRSQLNNEVDPLSVAQLLWRDEVIEILSERGVTGRFLRYRRSLLYQCLKEMLNICELRSVVRDYLMRRTNWRCPASLFPGDD